MSIGYIFALGAYLLWGVVPIYWKHLYHIPAAEILCHRVIWSFVFYFLILYWKQRSFTESLKPLKKSSGAILLAALLVSSNWLVYIYAVNSNQILQGSLAYFMNPLLNIVFGALLFKERLSTAIKIAVSLASIGVLILAWDGGHLPWLALFLAITFSLYGIAKKKSVLPAIVSVWLESLLLLIPAVIAAIYYRVQSTSSITLSDLLFLMGGGVITGLPILWFSEAALRIPYSSMGFMQFLSPTLQFICAVFLYSEPFQKIQMWAYGFVWMGVLLFLSQLLLAKNKASKKTSRL